MEDSNDRPRLRWCEELEASGAFYAKVLDPLGMKELVAREGTAGFGKTFLEFWLNHRPDLPRLDWLSGRRTMSAALKLREVAYPSLYANAA
jgi:hypothetical protein